MSKQIQSLMEIIECAESINQIEYIKQYQLAKQPSDGKQVIESGLHAAVPAPAYVSIFVLATTRLIL